MTEAPEHVQIRERRERDDTKRLDLGLDTELDGHEFDPVRERHGEEELLFDIAAASPAYFDSVVAVQLIAADDAVAAGIVGDSEARLLVVLLVAHEAGSDADVRAANLLRVRSACEKTRRQQHRRAARP